MGFDVSFIQFIIYLLLYTVKSVYVFNLRCAELEMACTANTVTLPLLPYSSYLISGPTNCGKTVFTKRIINERYNLFEKDPPEKILYCYGVHQPLYDIMQEETKEIEFHEGLPSEDTIDNYAQGKHLLIVLDDLMNCMLNSEMAQKLFMQSCHHKGLSVIYITQNLYQKGVFSRTIALNCTYLCLFHNVRDQLQVTCLGKQMYPGKFRVFIEAYQDSTMKKFGYLFIDLSPQSDHQFRLCTNIFSDEIPIIYTPNDIK